MAILRNQVPQRANRPQAGRLAYDVPDRIQTWGRQFGSGRASDDIAPDIPPPRPGVLRGDRLPTPANTLRTSPEYLYQLTQRNAEQANPYKRITDINERFPNMPIGVPQDAPGGQGLQHMRMADGTLMLLPRAPQPPAAAQQQAAAAPPVRLGEDGQPLIEIVPMAPDERGMRREGLQRELDMEARREDYQTRAQQRAEGLRQGRLARLAQEQQAARKPVTPIAANALQQAALDMELRRREFERTQTPLDATAEAGRLRTIGDVETALQAARAQQVGDIEVAQDIARARGLGEFGVAQDIARARQLDDMQMAGELSRLRQAASPEAIGYQDAIAQAELRRGQAARTEEQRRLQDEANGPPTDTAALSTWLEDQMARQTPEQFAQAMQADQRISPSRLRDLYDSLVSETTGFGNSLNWMSTPRGEWERKVAQREFLRAILKAGAPAGRSRAADSSADAWFMH